MKLLSINSSGRVDGNTGRTLALFERALVTLAEQSGISLEMERIELSGLALKHCIGCRACFDRGESACPHKDGLLTLRDALQGADGYIIGSPVYVEDVNGVMKTMIDRLAFYCHRPTLYGKSALLFTTSGQGSSSHALNTMSTAFGTWGIRTVCRMKFRLGARTPTDVIREKHGAAIQRTAQGFLKTLQKPFRPSTYSLIAFSVQQSCWRKSAEPRDSIDYRYWNESGWLERGRRYYDPAIARGLGARILYGIGKIVGLFFA